MKFQKVVFAGCIFLAFNISVCGQNMKMSGNMPGQMYDTVSVEAVADQFVAPLLLVESPDNSNRLFVVDQPGKIYIIKNGKKLEQPFLSITKKIAKLSTEEEEERGLLGLAFHPDFKNNGKFYVYYSAPLRTSAPKSWNHTNRIAEYTAAPNSDIADSSSEKILLQIDHPQMNHNAGMIAFGADGFLYISIGDGGGADDTYEGHPEDWYDKNKGGNGQNLQTLLGKILRVDVNSGNPYGIPADNPFINGGGRKEIYAYGFRNPYRFCFDPANMSQLIVADAGQELFEEIDVVKKGGNYGWNVKEGKHCFNASNDKQPGDMCPEKDPQGNTLIDPVIEFKNSMSFEDGLGLVSIGGVVYRGTALNKLMGKYLFGIWTTDHGATKGGVFAASQTGQDWAYKKLWIKGQPGGALNLFLLGFGQDSKGEVYILANNKEAPVEKSGRVLKLIPPMPDMSDMTSNDDKKKARQKRVHRIGPVVEYNLYVNDTTVNYTGHKRKALAINGQIPAPTLRFTEGDSAVINVLNNLKEEVSIHWHGVLLPNEDDGVPYLTTAPIMGGRTHTFHFRIMQSGTLWYHSHTAEQEQEGLYGPLVFYPADDTLPKTNEEVLQISDWRDERGSSILRSLKRRNDWYAIKKKAVQSWGEAIVKGHFSDKVQMEWNRMPGADVSDVYYNRFLMHGQPVRTIEKYKKGDSVRLRIVNGSAATYFWLNYSGGKIKVIAADGNDVKPIEGDKLLIATAETYDIIIQIPDNEQYELRATAQDISGYASAFFGTGSQVKVKDIPPLDYMVLMNEMNKITWTMKGMGMKMKMGLKMEMPEINMNSMGGMNEMQMDDMNGEKGMQMDNGNMNMNMKGMDSMKMEDKMNMNMNDMKGMDMNKDSSGKKNMNMDMNNMDSTNNKMDMKGMDHNNMPGMKMGASKKTSVKKPMNMKGMDMNKKAPSPKTPAKKTDKKKKMDPNMPGMKMKSFNNHHPKSIDAYFAKGFSSQPNASLFHNVAFVQKNGTYIQSSTLHESANTESISPTGIDTIAIDQFNGTFQDTTKKKKKRSHEGMSMGSGSSGMNMSGSGGMNMGGMGNMNKKDTSRSRMLMDMMPKMPMTGFDFPPGNGNDVVLSYDMLRADTGSTALPPDHPWREIKITLSGNMQRFVWSINGKTLSEQEQKFLIRRGENVRIVFTNATMMEHPMHLHGHFFRVINKQGENAPMKHTFNINAMATQVIEFAATEEKDWFLHCHTLFHMMGGMATIISYEGTESAVQKAYPAGFKKFKNEHGGGIYPWADFGFQSQSASGNLFLSGRKFQLNQDYRWNWKNSYDLETRFQYYLDKRQYFSVFAGAEFSANDVKNGKQLPALEQEKAATFGLIYTLPFLVDAEGRIDHKGKFRFQLRREDIPVTTHTRLDFYWNTDKEYGINAKYIVAKYIALSGSFDNQYGWGAGFSIIY